MQTHICNILQQPHVAVAGQQFSPSSLALGPPYSLLGHTQLSSKSVSYLFYYGDTHRFPSNCFSFSVVLCQHNTLWCPWLPHWRRTFLVFCVFLNFLLSRLAHNLHRLQRHIKLSCIINGVFITLVIIQDAQPTEAY